MGRIKTSDFNIRSIDVPYRFFFSKWIKKWNYRSFGWKCTDSYSETTSNGYQTTGSWSGDTYTSRTSETFITTKYIQFARPRAYNKYPFPNIIFLLLDIIFKIVNVMRKIFNVLIVPAIIGLIVLSIMEANIGVQYLGYGIMAFIGVFLAFDIVVCPLARITRWLFKIDEKIDDFFEENGYRTWTDEDEYE